MLQRCCNPEPRRLKRKPRRRGQRTEVREGASKSSAPPGTPEGVQIGKQALRQLHEKRVRRILSIAAAEGNEVVILGAFGCGAFRNPPEIVAEAMKTAVQAYRPFFQAIEFAVYCPPRDDSNYRVFERVLGRI